MKSDVGNVRQERMIMMSLAPLTLALFLVVVEVLLELVDATDNAFVLLQVSRIRALVLSSHHFADLEELLHPVIDDL